MSEQFYTAICERCGILFREDPGRCPDCGSDEILLLSACDGELLVLADNPEIKIDQTWWNEEQKRFHRLLRLFLDDLDRLKSIDGTLLSGTKTIEAESEALALTKRWLTNYPLENYASSLAGIRLRQTLNLVTARLRGESDTHTLVDLREMVASFCGEQTIPGCILNLFAAERAAHIQSEETEANAKRTGQILQARKTTVERHREKIKKLCRIWPLHSRWKDPIQTFSRMVDRLDFPETWREDIHSCLDKWNTTLIEKDKVSVALDAMERELAVLPKSSGRTVTDEKGYKLDFPKVEGMSVCSEVEAQAKARYIVLADSAKWEVSKPIIEDIPDPKVDLRDFAKGTEYKRQCLKRVLSEASRPVAFLFRNVKYWAIAGGTVFLAFWWISPLGRLAYGPEDAFWRPMFWMFFIFFGPLLAYNWRWHREEIARLRLSAETYGRSFDSSLSALRASESCDEEMKNRLSVLLERKREVDSKTIECVEIIRKTQGFRDLTWFSDAQERSDKAKHDFVAAWTCLLVAVKREVELLHRIEEWSKRGESLGAKRNKAFEALQTAVHKTCEQISAKRRELEASAREAEKNIGTCLDKLSDRAEAPDSETEALQATADSAALEADEARRVWEAAKAATDEAILRAEEEEKRRVEERLQFSRLKDRTIPEIRKRIETVRSSPDSTAELSGRMDALEADLSAWEKRREPLSGGLAEEETLAAGWKQRVGDIEVCLSGLRREKAEDFLRQACTAFEDGRFDECIAMSGECLAREPGREEATKFAADAENEIKRRKSEIKTWKTKATQMLHSVRSEDDQVSLPVLNEAKKINEHLHSVSSWSDHSAACKDFNLLTEKVKILEMIKELSPVREEALEIKQNASETIKKWRSLIPEQLYPKPEGQSADELLKTGDESARRGAREDARTCYEKAGKAAEDEVPIWKTTVCEAYAAMVKTAVFVSERQWLGKWMKNEIHVLLPERVNGFEPSDEDMECFLEFPWMTEGKTRIKLPRPQDVLFATGKTAAAGRWFAQLVRFSAEKKTFDLRIAGSEGEKDFINHYGRLVLHTEKLQSALSVPHDDLLDAIRRDIDWFRSIKHSREQALNWRGKAQSSVERAMFQAEHGTPDDIREAYLRYDLFLSGNSKIGEGHYAEATETFRALLEENGDSKSDIVLSVAERSVRGYFEEKDKALQGILAKWLEYNSDFSKESDKKLETVIRKFGAVPELWKKRYLSALALGEHHVLVRILEENHRVKVEHLIDAFHTIINAQDSVDLINMLWNPPCGVGKLRLILGRRCRPQGELQLFLFGRSTDAGD